MHRHSVFPRRLLAVAAASLLALPACAREADEDSALNDSATVAPAPAPPPAAAAPGVTDPQIAAIVVAANEVDIAAGEVARQKGTDQQVKDYGARMVTDHTNVNQQAAALVQRLGVTPEDNPTARQLRQGGDQNLANLQNLSGAEFDRAYIDHEVEYHQSVLDAIDNTLIPGATNAELRALLEQVRPAIADHLNMARQIQTALGGA
ncbi:MAG TPA: DUF4142 domain-containing protein [Longimicrobiaceae bacterium]|nr:DUF4142 domain-containing protein [Longimicrobiaceae bacterium]